MATRWCRHEARAFGLLTRAFINSPLTPLLLHRGAIVAGAHCRRLAAARGGAADQRADGRHHRCRPTATRPTRRSSSSPGRSRTSSKASTTSSTSIRRRGRPGRRHRALPRRHRSGTAILRVHEKIRANIADLPKGIPEPLIIGRGINDVAIVDPDAFARARQGRRMDRQRALSGRRGAAARTRQSRQCRRDLYRRRQPKPDSRRARSGEAGALRRDAEPADRQARQRQSLLPRRRVPRRRARRVPVVAGQTLAGRARHRPSAADDARRPAGLCQGRRGRRRRRGRARASRLDDDPRADGELERRPAVSVAVAKRKGANAVNVSPTDVMRRLEIVEGRIVPREPRDRGHAQLRRDRERKGERAAVPSGARDGLDRRPHHAGDRLARGRRRAHRHPDHDPADAVRRPG